MAFKGGFGCLHQVVSPIGRGEKSVSAGVAPAGDKVRIFILLPSTSSSSEFESLYSAESYSGSMSDDSSSEEVLSDVLEELDIWGKEWFVETQMTISKSWTAV